MNELTKCPKCGKQNKVTAQFCESCGTDLNGVANTSEPKKSKDTSGGLMGWWNKQSTKGKGVIGIVGICCLGLILIVGIGGLLSPDNSNTTTTQSSSAQSDSQSTPTTTTATTPQKVTIAQLYGSSIAKGTYVKVTGTVLQSDRYNLRIRNSNWKDVLVEGSDLSAYEDQSVTVVGTYSGPSSYTTVMGGERTVPTITDAKIVS
jgi:hypothetical protein